MTPEFIIDANELNFEYEVVAFSKNVPVLVDFWAEWCHPCKMLSPLLERLVQEANGSLRLAKVNIDQNPNLAMQYNVRSIPTVKAFVDGHVTAEFVGAQPEARLREFINKLTPPSPLELDLEKANGKIAAKEWSDAEKILRNMLTQNPNLDAAHLGLAKSLLAQGYASEALTHLDEIPAGRAFNTAAMIKPYAEALDSLQNDEILLETDLDAVFANSLRLAGQGKFPLALDGLLDILRENKLYRNKLAHNVILGILEIMGNEDPQTREYRAELATVLF
ncbi:MAG: thioredoxin [Chloroflexi bacterium]|nr:thioredoxin [Chloroflexota bacterium]